MTAFSRSWSALLNAVSELADEDFTRASGCRGWFVQDLICHLIIDAQDVLITLATPTAAHPTRTAATYWERSQTAPTGADPLDALTVRLAAAYKDPGLLRFHLDDVGSAAARAADLADLDQAVRTRGESMKVRDYLAAYVLESTLHHLDLIAHLPHVSSPQPAGLDRSRDLLEEIIGRAFPAQLASRDALQVGTGRRAPTAAESAALGDLRAQLPVYLG